MINVPSLISKNGTFLQEICSTRRKSSQQELVKIATDEQLLCLVKICVNILKGRVPLRKTHLKKQRIQAHALRRLARTRCSRSAKRVLLQEGKGLPAIAGLLTSIVVPMIANAIMHK